MGGRLPGGFSIRGLSGGERRRLNIAAGTRGLRGGFRRQGYNGGWGGFVWMKTCYHGIRDPMILQKMLGRSVWWLVQLILSSHANF